MKRNKIFLAVLLSVVFILTGCVTVKVTKSDGSVKYHQLGTTARKTETKIQKEGAIVYIVTYPYDALIYINGERKGNSPEELAVKLDNSFNIRLQEGHYEIEAKKYFSEDFEYYARKQIDLTNSSKPLIELKLEKRRIASTPGNSQDQVGNTYIEPEMVYVSGGGFIMGCASGTSRCFFKDETPAHFVELDSFYISKHEVTFEEWDSCVDNGGCDHIPDDMGWGRRQRPVINVSWNDAQKYIQWLNSKTLKGYRLPTEAEWEYSCKSMGQEGEFCGNGLDSIAWYRANSLDKTHSVGKKSPNQLGLFDMSGNVNEWVHDWYDGHYFEKSRENNPQGPQKGDKKVLKGCNWDSEDDVWCRATSRSGLLPNGRWDKNGFRLARDSQ